MKITRSMKQTKMKIVFDCKKNNEKNGFFFERGKLPKKLRDRVKKKNLVLWFKMFDILSVINCLRGCIKLKTIYMILT